METNLKATGSVKTKCRRWTAFVFGAEVLAGGAMVGSEVTGLSEDLVLTSAWL